VKRVLFVDDEPRILDGLRRMLRPRRGEWEVSFASSGQAALAELESAPADLVVTDMRMPVIDGVQLLSRVRERNPETLRVILSGHTDPGAAVRAAGVAHQFISKPASPDAVRGMMEGICAPGAAVPYEVRAIVGGVGSFPVAASALQRLSAALAAPECPASELAELVEAAPGVCAKLLQLVNSSFFGISPAVGDVKEALRMLSAGTLRDLLAAGVFHPLAGGTSAAFDADGYRCHCACVATAVAGSWGDVGYTAGLLHDVGKPILADHFPELYPRILAEARAAGIPPHQAERAALGTDHAEVGAYLLGIWNLPAEIVAAVRWHHADDADGLAAAIRGAHAP
jgi:putative nucleotidyltransferase with HDIG domain